MKKITAVFIAICCSISLFGFSNFSLDAGLGYMNYSLFTKYNQEKLHTLNKELSEHLALGGTGILQYHSPTSTDIYNALNLGLSLKYGLFYANLNIGLPFEQIPSGKDPLGDKLKELGATNKLKNSVITDLQLGGGLTILTRIPLTIFVGGAVAFGYISTNRNLPIEFTNKIKDHHGKPVQSLMETRTVSMLGLGADIALKYYFTKRIGICFDVKDSIYIVPMSNQRYYTGKDSQGYPFTYRITREKKDDIGSLVKYTVANNLTVRLGVAFKF